MVRSKFFIAAMALFVMTILGGPGSSSANRLLAQSPAVEAPGDAPTQPIAFSHKIHAGTVKLPCETCHELSKSGQGLTMPQAPLCMQCHQTIATDKPEVQKLAAMSKAGQIIPWVRVYQVPSFVRFSHKMHLDNQNTCKECHGDVAQQEQIFKATDISMAGCLSCHNVKKANVGCETCHTLDQSARLGPQEMDVVRDWRFYLRSELGESRAVPFWKVKPLLSSTNN
jgi:predicted CXXCH cytochrome family protein